MNQKKMTAAEFRRLKIEKPTKYRSQKTEAFGEKFDSKKEADRFGELRILERSGDISELKRQPKLFIEINGTHVCNYFADFSYIEKGKGVIEDCKSEITRKHPVYRLKKKLVAAIFQIEIKET